MPIRRPLGMMRKYPWHFFWLVDCSGSTCNDYKFAAINHAIRSTISEIRDVANDNLDVQLYIQVLRFSTDAAWTTKEPVEIEKYIWEDLVADEFSNTGRFSSMGKAFDLLAEQISMPPMPERAKRPVLILLSDCCPNDDWERSLDKLLNLPWGKIADKIGVYIDRNAADEHVLHMLQKFSGTAEMVLEIDDLKDIVTDMVTRIIW